LFAKNDSPLRTRRRKGEEEKKPFCAHSRATHFFSVLSLFLRVSVVNLFTISTIPRRP